MTAPPYRAARWVLWAGGTVNLVVYALPLLFFPEAWARAFEWEDPIATEFGLYAARCLGATAVAFSVGAFWAARDPWQHRIMFIVLASVCLLLACIHLYGILREGWPWPEAVEIATWTGLGVLALYVMPRRPPEGGPNPSA